MTANIAIKLDTFMINPKTLKKCLQINSCSNSLLDGAASWKTGLLGGRGGC